MELSVYGYLRIRNRRYRMSLDELDKQRKVYLWRLRTGNMVFKGTHKDAKTKAAEKHMKHIPYRRVKIT